MDDSATACLWLINRRHLGNANSAAMKAARAAIPADDASKMEVMMAAIKPGTGEVLGFGINKIYDTSPESG